MGDYIYIYILRIPAPFQRRQCNFVTPPLLTPHSLLFGSPASFVPCLVSSSFSLLSAHLDSSHNLNLLRPTLTFCWRQVMYFELN